MLVARWVRKWKQFRLKEKIKKRIGHHKPVRFPGPRQDQVHYIDIIKPKPKLVPKIKTVPYSPYEWAIARVKVRLNSRTVVRCDLARGWTTDERSIRIEKKFLVSNQRFRYYVLRRKRKVHYA